MDEQSAMRSLSLKEITNFFGSLLAGEELEVPLGGYLDIDPENDWEYGEFIGTLADGIRVIRRMLFRSMLYRGNRLAREETYSHEWR